MIRDSKRARATVYASKAGYRVTDEGDVISPQGNKRAINAVNTYYQFGVYYEKSTTTVNVHQLAAYQKFGAVALSVGMVVRHRNGVPTDNTPSNILIGTQRDNMLDQPKAVRVSRAKHAGAGPALTMEQARQLRRDHAQGWKSKRLCEEYGVSRGTVSRIVNGKTYAELS